MTEYFMILSNVKSILKWYRVLESPVKDNITTNKDNISNLSKFLYIDDTFKNPLIYSCNWEE